MSASTSENSKSQMRRFGVQSNKIVIKAMQACKCGSLEIVFVEGRSKCASCSEIRQQPIVQQ